MTTEQTKFRFVKTVTFPTPVKRYYVLQAISHVLDTIGEMEKDFQDDKRDTPEWARRKYGIDGIVDSNLTLLGVARKELVGAASAVAQVDPNTLFDTEESPPEAG